MHSEFIIVVSFREREGTGKVNKEDFNLCVSYFSLCKKIHETNIFVLANF